MSYGYKDSELYQNYNNKEELTVEELHEMLLNMKFGVEDLYVDQIFANEAVIEKIRSDIILTTELHAENIKVSSLDELSNNLGTIETGILKTVVLEGATGRFSGEVSGGVIYADGLDREFLYTNAVDINPRNAGIHLYLRPDIGGEVRATTTRTLNQYVPLRASAFRAPVDEHAQVTTDLELRILSSPGSSVYRNIRANGLHAEFIGVNNGTHFYVRPTDAGEVRVTAAGTIDVYQPIRAREFRREDGLTAYINETGSGNLNNPSVSRLWSGGVRTIGTHFYVGVDGELRSTNTRGFNDGGTITYMPIRGSLLYGNALDVNTGTHLYLRAASAGEVRVTLADTTDQYRNIRAREFITDTSLRENKRNIDVYDLDVLDYFRTAEVYLYNRVNEITHTKKQLGMMLDELPYETYSERGDGFGIYSLVAFLFRGLKQVIQDMDEIHDKIEATEGAG